MVQMTGLSKATVTTLVNEMIEEGILLEDGIAKQDNTQAGRKPIRLKINGSYQYAIGIELTGFECIAILCDISCNPVRIFRYPLQDRNIDSIVDTVCAAVNDLMHGFQWDRLLGIEIGIPAAVGVDGTVILQGENFGWFDIPLASLINERVGKPVSLIKRQNAGAVGEYWYGAGRGHTDLVYISYSLGIGSGIITDHQLLTGHDNSSGEFGHMTVVPNGLPCLCGNFGCLETVASIPAILQKVIALLPDHPESILFPVLQNLDQINADWVLSAAEQGDELARLVIQDAVGYLAIGITNLVNLLNPSLVVLGGQLADYPHLFVEPIRAEVLKRGFSVSTKSIKIVPSTLGYTSVAIGAASLIIDRFFS